MLPQRYIDFSHQLELCDMTAQLELCDMTAQLELCDMTAQLELCDMTAYLKHCVNLMHRRSKYNGVLLLNDQLSEVQ